MTQENARRTNNLAFLLLPWPQKVPGSNPGAPTTSLMDGHGFRLRAYAEGKTKSRTKTPSGFSCRGRKWRSIAGYAWSFLRTIPARPNKPEPMSRSEAGSGVTPPGFPMPVVPIKRHCSYSLQAPGWLFTLFPPGQGLALTRSNPAVSNTWALSMNTGSTAPLMLMVTVGAMAAQVAGFAIANAFPGSQLFVLSNPPDPKSLVSKLNEPV